jgi:MSHA biogenesis protein MshJ
MKRWWSLLATRIDALSLRERVFLFFTLLVLLVLLADVLWLSPAQQYHRQWKQRVAAQETEINQTREALRLAGAETAPGVQMRSELQRIEDRLAEIDRQIAALPLAQADQPPLQQVLVHFLRRHEGLVLVRTATLPPEKRQDASGGYRRQILELTVAGPYAELTRYVQTLERALPALRWGVMKLDSPKQPPELTLQVWLVVGDAP